MYSQFQRACVAHAAVVALLSASAVQDLEKRVADYAKLRKTAEAGLPPLRPTKSQAEIAGRQRALAGKIRELRAPAKQGDIFPPDVAAEFRARIAAAMKGKPAARIRRSLKSGEPVAARLAVNTPVPDRLPLPSMPPTLLLNLPKLAPDIEYRVTGRDLVLLDTKSNLVIDLIPDAIP